MIIWTGIITLIIGPLAWAFRYLVLEVKAQQLLLRETREDYVKKQDLKSEMEDLHKKNPSHALSAKIGRGVQ